MCLGEGLADAEAAADETPEPDGTGRAPATSVLDDAATDGSADVSGEIRTQPTAAKPTPATMIMAATVAPRFPNRDRRPADRL